MRALRNWSFLLFVGASVLFFNAVSLKAIVNCNPPSYGSAPNWYVVVDMENCDSSQSLCNDGCTSCFDIPTGNVESCYAFSENSGYYAICFCPIPGPAPN